MSWRGEARRLLRLELLETRCLLDAGPVFINELMGKNNQTTYENNAGNFTGFVELYNPTSAAVALGNGAAQTITGITYGTPDDLTATVTTAGADGYSTGQWVSIAGATPTQYDGAFSITVLTPDSFTFTMASSPGSDASGSMTATAPSYYLTNDSTNLSMWAFPSGVSIAAGGYLVVTCNTPPSGATAGGAYTNTTAVGPWPAGTTQYYTGFTLPKGGGYVALVQPDAQTIASQYDYPQQTNNVAYGIAPSTPSSLVAAGASATYLVPTATSATSGWQSVGFNDSSWSSGETGLGFGAGTPPTTLPLGYYAPFGPNGTWNYYEVVSTATVWTTAEANAQNQTFQGVQGNLVTIRSAAEVTFLDSLMGGAEYWTGLTNSTSFGGTDYGPEENNALPTSSEAPSSTTVGIASITFSGTTATATTTAANGLSTGQEVLIAGATPSQYDGSFAVSVTGANTFTYTMTSTPSSNASGTMTCLIPQRGDGFVWQDGEAFTYQNWESGQPNNTGGGSPSNDVAALGSGSTAGQWDDRSGTGSSFAYAIEFNLGLASPPDNGYLSVVQAKTTSALTSITQGMSLLSSPGSATVSNYTASVADYYDPENVVTSGHFASFPFGDSSAAQTTKDHDLAVKVQGTIQVATPGVYTFDVTSSDGFQLSITGATFSGSSSGTTYGTAMTFGGTPTIADSLGVTNSLAAGTYPFVLYYFNGASDAPRLEFSAAAGTQSSFNSNFHLVGDTTDGGLALVGGSSLIDTNVQSAMQGVNATALVRIPFSVDDPSQVSQLTLLMNYDDGFIAYLNGVQVASENAPLTPAWNSTATAWHGWSQAQSGQSFNLAADQGDLVAGANILAIQGLNLTAGNPSFLVLPQLEYSAFDSTNVEYLTPEIDVPNVPANLGTVPSTSFSVPEGFYIAPFYTSITESSSSATILYTLDGRTPVIPIAGSSETISSITYSGTTATVTTASAHGYFTGDQVQIAGASPAQYDGVFNVSVLGANTFTYTMASSPGSNASGTMTATLIPVSTVNSRTINSIAFGGSGGLTATASAASVAIGSITFSGTTATVTTTATDNFYNSQQVQIAGASPSVYNGNFIITVTSATTFTYSMKSTPGSNASGAMTATSLHGYSTGELIQISGATQWQYDGVFAIASVPSATTFTYIMSISPGVNASGAMTVAAVSTMTYTGPIYIGSTTTLRTEAFEVGYDTSYLDTATYVFMAAVVNQPQIFTDNSGAGALYTQNQQYVTNPNFNGDNYPQMWTGIDSTDTDPYGGSPTNVGQTDDQFSADYGMDPQVVDDPDYASTIISDMQSIPTISLVMNPDDWFGTGTGGTNGIDGIYVNSAQQDANGAASPLWKRDVSSELINPDGSVGFQANAQIKMHGGGSDDPNKEAEHSFTLEFDSNLDYPLFGPDGASQFNELTLRAGYNDAWTHGQESQRQYGSYLQDEFANAELAAMGGPDRHSTWVNLFINGIYWGLYNPTEYPDSNFAANYFGDSNTGDYDTIKVSETGPPVADDGNANAWNALYVAASNAGAMNPVVSISSLSCSSTSYNATLDSYTTTVTATTATADGYSTGANVYISGAFPSQYDGYFVITVVNSTTFTYQYSGAEVAQATGTISVAQIAASNPNALASPASLAVVEQYLDVPEFISYMLDMGYGGNNDWQAGTNHNWIAIGESRSNGVPTTAGDGFQFINWDGERTLEGTTDNVINSTPPNSGLTGTPAVENFGPLYLFDQLKVNPEFQLMFADAIQKYMFNNGPLTPTGAAAIYSTVSQPIDRAIVGQSAKWGDYRRDINYDGPGTGLWQGPAYLYTRNGLANSSTLLNGSTTLFNNAADPTSFSSITSITHSGATATVTTSLSNGFTTGELIGIAGATPSQYDGSFSITVTGSNTFTYTMASAPASNASLLQGTTMTATYADTWIGNQNRLFGTYFPARTANVIAQFQAAGVYPTSVAAPQFSPLPSGGVLTGSLTVTNPGGAGTIYYTTDGSDPRTPYVPGTVLALGAASSVSEITLIGTTATVRVPDNGYANGQTVAISGATPSNYDGNFVISGVTQDTFTITVTGSPAAASGTILCQPYGISPSGNSVIVWLPDNGLAAGNNVLMSGAVQETALNGVFAVTAATANTFTFTLPGASLDSADTAITAQRVDVDVSGITFIGTTATVTTASANSYTSGQLVRIVGANVSNFNGDYLISVLNSTQFTYTMSSTPSGAPTNGGFIGAVAVLSPTAKVYSGPITLSQTTQISAQILSGTTWSAMNSAWFIVAAAAAAAGNLAITQVNYDPVGPTAAELAVNPGFKGDDFQFMQLQNIGSQTIDLTGVQLTLADTLAFSFSGSAVTTLAPGACVLIIENPQAFTARYGAELQTQYGPNWQALLVAGEFVQKLAHGGERVLLTDRLGNTIEDFTYNNGGAWPGRPDNNGSTLEILNPTDDPTNPNNWESSVDVNGSPGGPDTATSSVVINEVVPNITSSDNGSIELFNPTSSTVNIGGWYLTDTLSDLEKFTIPAGTQIAAGQYLQFDDNQYDVTPYSGNVDGVVTETTDSSGVTPELQLQGDTVNELTERQIILPAGTIVAGQDMVLLFDFMSDTEGNVQGIGLDTGNTYGGTSTLFRIYGTGATGTQVTNGNGYYSTPGIWQTYTINLGVLPTNETHLFFYIDDATSGSGYAGADESFRNTSVYVQGASPAYIDFDQYFGLDNTGGSVWLVSADSSGNPLGFQDHASYGAAGGGEGQGRWPNGSGSFYAMSSVTTDAANSGSLLPSSTSADSLVISEVMYDPPGLASGLPGQQLEYVMITNISTSVAVTLTGWRLRSAISYNFPSGQTLAAGASLVVVPFDPVNNPDALSRLEARYPGYVSSGLVMDGPYSGALSNGGETLDLEQPGTPLPSTPTSTPRLIEDEVAYSNTVPWPTAAYGGGDSLQRVMSTIGWGDAAASWTAGPPTLGLLEAAPVGNVDVYATTGGNPITINAVAGVLANDQGNSLQALLVTPPAYGGLAFNANGSFTYTPYFGQQPDSFQYQAYDGALQSNTVTVLINPPLAVSHSYSLNTQVTLTLAETASTGVLHGDSDSLGNPLLAELITSPVDGSLTLNGDGSFIYVSNPGFSGTDTFTYAASEGVVEFPGVDNFESSFSGFGYGNSEGAVQSAPVTVSITVISPPSVVTPAGATPSPVTGTIASLSALGTDSAGASALTYTWGATTVPSGAAAPTFSANGTNAAKNVSATFNKAGNYTFQVTITDPNNLTATSSVNVTVNQTLTAIAISPPLANMNAGAAQQFTATGMDQFDNALTTQPSFAWTTTVAGGAIDSGSGRFETPDTTAIGTVTAASGSISGYATAVVIYEGQAHWNSGTGGSWSTAGNWVASITHNVIAAPGVRGIAGDTALFGSAAASTVNLNGASPSLAGVTFNSGSSGYTIAQGTGSGTLYLNNGGSGASITVSGGNQAISAPVGLVSSVVVSPASGSSLAISGSISGAGSSLTVDGGGTVTISGANSYTGGTIVTSGTLVAANAGAIPSGASLFVGAGGESALDSGQTTAPAVATSTLMDGAVSTAPVPAAGQPQSDQAKARDAVLKFWGKKNPASGREGPLPALWRQP